jgi:hypothetical protein
MTGLLNELSSQTCTLSMIAAVPERTDQMLALKDAVPARL